MKCSLTRCPRLSTILFQFRGSCRKEVQGRERRQSGSISRATGIPCSYSNLHNIRAVVARMCGYRSPLVVIPSSAPRACRARSQRSVRFMSSQKDNLLKFFTIYVVPNDVLNVPKFLQEICGGKGDSRVILHIIVGDVEK